MFRIHCASRSANIMHKFTLNLIIHILIFGIQIGCIRCLVYEGNLDSSFSSPLATNLRCSTYGICKDGSKKLPCSYSGPPKLFDPNVTRELRELCPQLPGVTGNSVYTCCDVEQMQNLKSNMRIPTSMLGKCPACLRDFINIFCVLTCHPDQASFMIRKSLEGPSLGYGNQTKPFLPPKTDPMIEEGSSSTAVHQLDYHVTDVSAKAIFRACKDVTFFTGKAINLMCRKRDSLVCTYDGFFNFLGDNPQNPLRINFYFGQQKNYLTRNLNVSGPPIVPIEIPNFACDKPLPGSLSGGGGGACLCKDCEAACVEPMPVLRPDDPFWLGGTNGPLPWTVAGIDGMIFVMTCIFLAFLLIFGSALVCNTLFCATSTRSKDQNHLLDSLFNRSVNDQTLKDGYNIGTIISPFQSDKANGIDVYDGGLNGRFVKLILPSSQSNNTQDEPFGSRSSSFRKQLAEKFNNTFTGMSGPGSAKLKRGVGVGGESTEKFVIDPTPLQNVHEDGTDVVNDDDVTNGGNKKVKNYIPPHRKSFGPVGTHSPFKRNWRQNMDTSAKPNSSIVDNDIDNDHCKTTKAAQNKKIKPMGPGGNGFQGYLSDRFKDWGYVCARYPGPVLTLGVTTCLILSCGLMLMRVTTDPVELWSAPSSRARQELTFFNEHFTPFYRIQQIIVTPHDTQPVVYGKKTYGPVFKPEFLIEVLKLQSELSKVEVYNGTGRDGGNSQDRVILEDICFKPLSPVNNDCTIQSLFQYYQNSQKNMEMDIDSSNGSKTPLLHFESCSKEPLKPDCLGLFGGPVYPWFVFGGYKGEEFQMAKALIITFVVNNEPSNQMKSEIWEKAFIAYLQNYTNPLFNFTFQAQRSIQDEIDRESKSDIFTIALSYFIMFLYIAIALGHFRSFKTLLVDSRISIGIAGVFIVVASVTSSIGTFSYIGVPATLIIMEVVPFLVLAVGIDNVFILVHQTRRIPKSSPETTVEEHIGDVLGFVGPSMLLTSLSESVAFFIGAFSNMPAVQIFSLYAGLAVLFDFCLQVTCFISLLAMDMKRLEARRNDICCCLPPVDIENLEEMSPANEDGNSNDKFRDTTITNIPTTVISGHASVPANLKDFGFLYNFTLKYYAPFLLNFWVRAIMMILYVAGLCLAITFASRVHIGLDQKVSMPHDSYVLRHFEAMENYLSVGPPVYFVLKVANPNDQQPQYYKYHEGGAGDHVNLIDLQIDSIVHTSSLPGAGKFDLTSPNSQNMICSSINCDRYSMVNMISWHSQYPNISYLSPRSDVSSWIDDYFDWIAPNSGCCKLTKDSKPPDNMTLCPLNSPNKNCKDCSVAKDKDNRPIGTDFYSYLPLFLDDLPGPSCPKGGKAAYSHALQFTKSNNKTVLSTSYFMTYHTVLKHSNDFILALRHARLLSDNITRYLNARIDNVINKPNNHLKGNLVRNATQPEYVQVFPYSVFYVFYEQYLTIVRDAIWNLTICIAAIFVVTLICCCGLKGALGLTLIVTFSIVSITIGLFAFMRLFGIELNAVSLVNCVMALGISVEFISHMVRGFAVHANILTQQIRNLRKSHNDPEKAFPTIAKSDIRIIAAKRALTDTGSSVFSGIALTKLLGICVLAFSKSRIFSLYYFRMYLGVVFLGTLQGLVFLPVILSYLGPVAQATAPTNNYDFSEEESLAPTVRGKPSGNSRASNTPNKVEEVDVDLDNKNSQVRTPLIERADASKISESTDRNNLKKSTSPKLNPLPGNLISGLSKHQIDPEPEKSSYTNPNLTTYE